MNRLLAFYYGGMPDDHGRMLAEITRQDDLWLEVTHNYIQWLFPLKEMSRVTPDAPVVDKEVLKAFNDDELLRKHLFASFVRMLAFYGLVRNNGEIVKGNNWEERKSNWFTDGTHNNLRITRILKSLTILGLCSEAKKLMNCLDSLRVSEPDCGIDSSAYTFWHEAVLTHNK